MKSRRQFREQRESRWGKLSIEAKMSDKK